MSITHPLIDIALRVLPRRFHDHLVVFGSAPLVFAGLKTELRDLDLLVSEEGFGEIVAEGFVSVEPAPGVAFIRLATAPSDIELYRAWPAVDFANLHAAAKPTTQSGGLRVASLGDMLSLKLATNREKDQPDIQLLRAALE